MKFLLACLLSVALVSTSRVSNVEGWSHAYRRGPPTEGRHQEEEGLNQVSHAYRRGPPTEGRHQEEENQ